MQSNDVSTVFLLLGENLLFQGKKLKIVFSWRQSQPAQTFDMTLIAWRFSKVFVCKSGNDHHASPADLPPLVRHPPSSCSCLSHNLSSITSIQYIHHVDRLLHDSFNDSIKVLMVIKLVIHSC